MNGMPDNETLRRGLELEWQDFIQTRGQTWRTLEIEAALIVGMVGADFKFDNRWVIDPIVNLAGRVGVALSNFSSLLDNRFVDGAVNLVGRVAAVLSGLYRLFDIRVVNGAVDLAGRLTQSGGEWLRPIQTGRLQNYLLVALVTVLTLLGLYLFYWW